MYTLAVESDTEYRVVSRNHIIIMSNPTSGTKSEVAHNDNDGCGLPLFITCLYY